MAARRRKPSGASSGSAGPRGRERREKVEGQQMGLLSWCAVLMLVGVVILFATGLLSDNHSEGTKQPDPADKAKSGQSKRENIPRAAESAASKAEATSQDPDCADKNDECYYWAQAGECEKNPGYMLINCQVSCGKCGTVEADPDQRCKRNPELKPEIEPNGGLNAIFERIVSDPEIQRLYTPEVVLQDPWIITLDNFVKPDEIEGIIAVTSTDFERSSSAGKKQADGQFKREFTDYRTSHNAWCQGACERSPANRAIRDRIAWVTNTSAVAQESMQVLRYEPGQYYKVHHDYIFDHRRMPCGPRILTAFVYFSDVEEGGTTDFPKLNITVRPKAGRMLLWPSVLDSDPEEMDPRTDHEAVPVIKGTKYAGNAWIHLYDFATPNSIGCTG